MDCVATRELALILVGRDSSRALIADEGGASATSISGECELRTESGIQRRDAEIDRRDSPGRNSQLVNPDSPGQLCAPPRSQRLSVERGWPECRSCVRRKRLRARERQKLTALENGIHRVSPHRDPLVPPLVGRISSRASSTASDGETICHLSELKSWLDKELQTHHFQYPRTWR